MAEQHEWFRKLTTGRRSLLRGGLVGAGVLAAGPGLLAGRAQGRYMSPARTGGPDRGASRAGDPYRGQSAATAVGRPGTNSTATSAATSTKLPATAKAWL
ncbi:hypothetical protein ABH935_003485 [Catenulispora sp. GAS73]